MPTLREGLLTTCRRSYVFPFSLNPLVVSRGLCTISARFHETPRPPAVFRFVYKHPAAVFSGAGPDAAQLTRIGDDRECRHGSQTSERLSINPSVFPDVLQLALEFRLVRPICGSQKLSQLRTEHPESFGTRWLLNFRKAKCLKPDGQIIEAFDLFMHDLALGRPVCRVDKIEGEAPTDESDRVIVRVSHSAF